MQLNDVVLSYKEEMVSQLCKLISMPSLEAPPLPGQPFGRAMHDCLLYTLDLAKSLGFARMRDVDGYAGYIEMGQGEEEIGILVHLDVVPPGDGWTLPPCLPPPAWFLRARCKTAGSTAGAARTTKAASSRRCMLCAPCFPRKIPFISAYA